MTIPELYAALKQKGYVHLDLEEMRNVGDIPSEEELRDYLELDRREVFRMWYGEPGDDVPFDLFWFGRLRNAQKAYGRGQIEYELDYLLENP